MQELSFSAKKLNLKRKLHYILQEASAKVTNVVISETFLTILEEFCVALFFFFWTGLLKLFAPRDDHVFSEVFVILTANEDPSDWFMFSLMASLLERMSGTTNDMC